MNKRTLSIFLRLNKACWPGIYTVKMYKDLKSLYNDYDNAEHIMWLISIIETNRKKLVQLYYDLIIASGYNMYGKDRRNIKGIEYVKRYLRTGKTEREFEDYKYDEDDIENTFALGWLIDIIGGERYQTFMVKLNNDISLKIIHKAYSYRRLQFLLNNTISEEYKKYYSICQELNNE